MFELGKFSFLWYSLRRVGASWGAKRCGLTDNVLVLGRWGQSKAARIYVNGALAASVHVKPSTRPLALMHEAIKNGTEVILHKYQRVPKRKR